MDLSYNNFSGTALLLLLQHRRIETFSGNLHWEVVGLHAKRAMLHLTKEKDAIKISHEIKGHFNIEESTLVIKGYHKFPSVAYLEILFEAKCIQFPEELYVKHKNLPELSKSQLEKMSKIFLDCTEEEIIDWSVLETFLNKYQFEVLDIAVNGQTFPEECRRILERRTTMSISVHIDAMFYVEEADDIRKIVEACQQKKIADIRCIVDNGCRVSLDEISSLVKNSNSKRVTLIYVGQDDMLKGDDLKKAEEIANDIDSELEVSRANFTESTEYFEKRQRMIRTFIRWDAWPFVDYKFYDRSKGLKLAGGKKTG